MVPPSLGGVENAPRPKLLVLRNVGASVVIQLDEEARSSSSTFKTRKGCMHIQRMYKHHAFLEHGKMLRQRLQYALTEEEEWYEMEAMALRIQQRWRMRAAWKALQRLSKIETAWLRITFSRPITKCKMQCGLLSAETRKKVHINPICNCCALAGENLQEGRLKSCTRKTLLRSAQYRLRSMIAVRMMKLLRKSAEDKAKEKSKND